MTDDYELYLERKVMPDTPIFWTTLEAWEPPSEVEMVWLLLAGEIEQRFAEAVETIREL